MSFAFIIFPVNSFCLTMSDSVGDVDVVVLGLHMPSFSALRELWYVLGLKTAHRSSMVPVKLNVSFGP